MSCSELSLYPQRCQRKKIVSVAIKFHSYGGKKMFGNPVGRLFLPSLLEKVRGEIFLEFLNLPVRNSLSFYSFFFFEKKRLLHAIQVRLLGKGQPIPGRGEKIFLISSYYCHFLPLLSSNTVPYPACAITLEEPKKRKEK